MAAALINRYAEQLRARFGGTVAKVSLDLGRPCPHRAAHPPGCAFCRPGVIVSERISRLAGIPEQLALGKEAQARRYHVRRFLAYFQSETSTHGPLPELLAAYDAALNDPEVVGLVISTRPDCLPSVLLGELGARAREKPVFLELGLQSSHDDTLRRIARGHDYACFLRALEAATAAGLETTAHLILGLPGETGEQMVQTVRRLAETPLAAVKLHHLQIHRDTPFAQAFARGEVGVFQRFEDYLPVLCEVLRALPWRIFVARVVADSPGEPLIAPKWGLSKSQIYERLDAYLAERGARQGDRAF